MGRFIAPGAASVLVAFVFGLIVFSPVCFADDADILLQWQSAFEGNFTFRGWNVANKPNLCLCDNDNPLAWYGICCNTQSQVARVVLSGGSTRGVANGTFSPALSQLPALDYLFVSSHRIYGSLPEEYFHMPTLRYLGLKKMPLTLRVPSNVSQTLLFFDMNRVNLTGSIPNDSFNWTRMGQFEVRETELSCPLPAGLIARMQLPNPPNCKLFQNLLSIDNGMVCGQIRATELNCHVYPQQTTIKQNPTPGATRFTAPYQDIQLEFEDYDTFIYPRFPNGSVYRQDWVVLNIAPMVPRSDDFALYPVHNFDVTPFSNMTWATPSELRISQILRNRFNQIMRRTTIFYFGIQRSNIQIGNSTIKFSVQVTNINVTYTTPKIDFNALLIYRTYHSRVGGPPPNCTEFAPPASLGQCYGEVADVTVEFVTVQDPFDSTLLGLLNDRIHILFSYGVIGSRDGIDLRSEIFSQSPNRSEIEASKYFPGVGVDDNTQYLMELGRGNLLRPARAESEQAMLLWVRVTLANFNEVFYDPDISLALLVGTSSNPPIIAPPGTSNLITDSSAATIGTVVGVVVVVIIIGVIVAIVLYKRHQRAEEFKTKHQQVLADDRMAKELDDKPLITAGSKSKSKSSTAAADVGTVYDDAFGSASATVFQTINSGDLSILGELGKGSFGVVQLGQFQGQFCAIKMLSNQSKAAVDAFMKEALLMQSLRKHPNVTEMIGMCLEPERYAVVMEFCPRGNLLVYLQLLSALSATKTPSLDDYSLFKILYGICNGMKSLAEQGIVHRDLAARNVLLGENLITKISDFGFSRQLESSQSVGVTQNDLGPIRWMAPENLKSQTYSESSDVWAFGCCIVEIITGNAPYARSNPSATIADLAVGIKERGMNPLGDIHSVQTPKWLQDLIVPCFDPNPAGRPSFAQLCQKLEQLHPQFFVQYMAELDAPRSVLNPSKSTTGGAGAASNSGGKWVRSAKASNAIAPDSLQATDASQVKLIAKLGEGSFGTVHLAQLKDGKFVALKKLNPGSSSADAHREASVMTQLPAHPNLVQMLGIFVDKGSLSIALQFLSHGSLESFVHKWWKKYSKTLPEIILFRFSLHTARGMAALAKQKIVHRDLSARNVLLDENLSAKISDFGLSRVVDQQGSSGKTQSDVGPIRWYAPECFSQTYSEKSDVWAWACCVIEICTGQVPFPSLDLVTVLSRVRESRQSALDYLPPGTTLPNWLRPLLQQCFQYDPAMRPTFKNIVQELEKNAPDSVRIVETALDEQRQKREAIRSALNDAGL